MSSIGAATTLCGIVLHPAGHTRSPAMHNAAFAEMGIDAAYVAFDVEPAALGDAIHGARALGIRQLAVSIPHKEAVIQHLDSVSDTARSIGAVNTVTRQPDGRLHGDNTDWLGLVRALERECELAGRKAVVLGAGGTARAAVHGLQARGARVCVLNRTLQRAEALVAEMGADSAGTLDSLATHAHDVLVQTTSVGLRDDTSPVAASALRSGSVVLDAVYDPEETRLLREARAAGARTVAGKWMLVEQAREQIRLWSGQEPPGSVMERAFDDAGTSK